MPVLAVAGRDGLDNVWGVAHGSSLSCGCGQLAATLRLYGLRSWVRGHVTQEVAHLRAGGRGCLVGQHFLHLAGEAWLVHLSWGN